MDEALEMQAEMVEHDARHIPTAKQKLDAVTAVVDLLEPFSDEGRKAILDLAGNILRPAFDRHDFAMKMIDAVKHEREAADELRAAVKAHRDGSSSQVRNVDKALWATFGLEPDGRDARESSEVSR